MSNEVDVIEQARARVNELQNQADQSAANHNMIIGRMLEARERLATLEKKEQSPVDAEVVAVAD